MNIIVCVKQVPATSKVEVDEKTGVLKRTGVECKMNPYDLYALETALRLREETEYKECTITAVTMGPPQAEAVMREAYMMGVDRGVLLSDMRFAGADVLATSYTLSQGIKVIGKYDLIICGRQTTDGDTAQVGPAVAEHLGIPHVAWVCGINHADEQRIVVEQDMADSIEVVELGYPCLITVEKNINQPRLPSYRLKLKTDGRAITTLTLDDFTDRDERGYGLKGSPTQVERIFPPETNTRRMIWESSGDELADKCFRALKNLKYI